MTNKLYALLASIVSAVERLFSRIKNAEDAAKKADNVTEGVFPVARGGSGNGSFTKNSLILGNGENALGEILNALGVLVSNGEAAPEFKEFLPLEYGGVGANTADAARGVLGVAYKPVLLWRGTLSAAAEASLTVAESGGSAGCTGLGNISDYKELRFVHSEGVAYEVINNGTHLYGGGSYYSTGEKYAYTFAMAASISGNTISITANKYLNLSHSDRKTGNVWDNFVEIYGMVRISDIITA